MIQNNSASMKTVVETYVIEETQELIYDNEKLDQWNSFVQSLGLQGQQKVVKLDKSPVPFLWMNSTLKGVFEELCPRKVDIQLYDKTPIPVEILSLVALSQKEEYFYRIEVWYNEKDADPCVVGLRDTRGETGYMKDWYAEKYLLGRWADMKATLGELTKRAKKIFIKRRTNELNAEIKKHSRELEDLQITANEFFGNEDMG